jgi:hypothetical protein
VGLKRISEKCRGSKFCASFNPHIDFTAEGPEVDWFCEQRLSAVLQSLALRLSIAVGGDHETGTSGRKALALGNSSRPLIPGMLM